LEALFIERKYYENENKVKPLSVEEGGRMKTQRTCATCRFLPKDADGMVTNCAKRYWHGLFINIQKITCKEWRGKRWLNATEKENASTEV